MEFPTSKPMDTPPTHASVFALCKKIEEQFPEKKGLIERSNQLLSRMVACEISPALADKHIWFLIANL